MVTSDRKIAKKLKKHGYKFSFLVLTNVVGLLFIVACAVQVSKISGITAKSLGRLGDVIKSLEEYRENVFSAARVVKLRRAVYQLIVGVMTVILVNVVIIWNIHHRLWLLATKGRQIHPTRPNKNMYWRRVAFGMLCWLFFEFSKVLLTIFIVRDPDIVREGLLSDLLSSFFVVLLLSVPLKRRGSYIWAGMRSVIVIALIVALLFDSALRPKGLTPVSTTFKDYDQIVELCQKYKFPVKNVLVSRSLGGLPNAYQIGYGKDGVIVLMNMGDKMNTQGVVGIFGHELGHWVNAHFIKKIMFLIFRNLFTIALYLILTVQTPLLVEFGFGAQAPIIVRHCLVLFLLKPAEVFLSLTENGIGSVYENTADVFAAKNTAPVGICVGLMDVATRASVFIFSTPFYELFFDCHPPIFNRIMNVKRFIKN